LVEIPLGAPQNQATRRPRNLLISGLTNEGHRIDTLTIAQDFKVQVGPGRPTGCAHQGNNLALFDLIANDDQVFRIMCPSATVMISAPDLPAKSTPR